MASPSDYMAQNPGGLKEPFVAPQRPMPFVDAQQVFPGLPRTNSPSALPMSPGSLYGAGLGSGVGDAANQGLLSGEPTSEDEKTRNVEGWDKFLTSLDNPAAQDMLMTFGGMLMQPRAPGQSFAGHIGASAMGGLQAGRQRQDILARQGIEQQRTDIAKQQLEANKEYQTGSLAQRKAEAEAEQKRFELSQKAAMEKAKLDTQIERLKIQQKNREIDLEVKKAAAEQEYNAKQAIQDAMKLYENLEGNTGLNGEREDLGTFVERFQRNIALSMGEQRTKNAMTREWEGVDYSMASGPAKNAADVHWKEMVELDKAMKAAQEEYTRLSEETAKEHELMMQKHVTTTPGWQQAPGGPVVPGTAPPASGPRAHPAPPGPYTQAPPIPSRAARRQQPPTGLPPLPEFGVQHPGARGGR